MRRHISTFMLMAGVSITLLSYSIIAAAGPGDPSTNLATVTLTSTPTPTSCGRGAWITAPPLPPPSQRAYHYAFAQANNSFYILSGDDNNFSPYSFRYDAASNTWTQLAQMPSPHALAAASLYNGKIYFTGGQPNPDGPDSELFIYDTAQNSWSSATPMNHAVAGSAAGSWNGKVFVAGGLNNQFQPQNWLQVYDIASNSWMTGTNLPLALDLAGYTQVGQYLYLIGGFTDTSANATTSLRLDMATGTWSMGPTFTMQRADFALTFASGNLYAIGGDLTGGGRYDASAEVDELDLSSWPSGTWITSTPSLPSARAGNSGGFYTTGRTGGEIWSIGGDPGFDNLYSPLDGCFTPSPTATITATPTATSTPTCAGWSLQTTYPIGIYNNAVVTLNGNLYSFGGIGSGGIPVTNTFKYDGSNWTSIASLPNYRAGQSAVTDGTYIYLLNGFDDFDNPVAELLRYDPAADSYTNLTPPSLATAEQAAVYLGGKLYRIAGRVDAGGTPTNSVQVYTISSQTWTTVTAYPLSVRNLSATTIGGYIYTAGGLDSSGTPLAKTYRYDTGANSWDDAAITDLPSIRWGAAAGQFNGEFLMAGGYFTNNFTNTATSSALTWNPSANSWSDIPPLVSARAFAGGATLGNAFYAVGGAGAMGSNNNVNQRYVDNCPTSTPTLTPGPGTATPSASATPAGGTNTPSPTLTATPLAATPTSTSLPPTATTMPTSTPPPATNTPIATPPPTSTSTLAAPSPTSSTLPTATSTLAPPTNTSTPSATPTDCSNLFVDINNNIFYTAIHYLNCLGVVNGTDATHYSPAGTSTRGQFAKVVVLGFGIPSYTPPGNPDFSDVPANYFAYLYIESGFHAGILSGFDPASCQAAAQIYPCYLPNRPITRGQLTKLVVNAAGYPLFTPTGGQQTFTDVPPSNVFFVSIETAHYKGVINGYPDGTFRPNNNIRRDEMAQIVYKGVTTP